MFHLCSTLRNSDIVYLGKSLILDHVTCSSQWGHEMGIILSFTGGLSVWHGHPFLAKKLCFKNTYLKSLRTVIPSDNIQEIHSWIATLSLTKSGYWLFSKVMNKQPDNSGTFQMSYITAWLEYNFQISSTSCPCSWHKVTGWSTP